MAKLELFPLAAWVRFYSDFSVKTLNRMQEALEAIEEEKYSPQKFVSDTVQFWNQGSMGWWTALQQSMTEPVPTLFVQMRPDSQSVPGTPLVVKASGPGAPQLSEVIRIGGPQVSGAKRPGGPIALENRHLQLIADEPGGPRYRVAVTGLSTTDESKALSEQPNFAPGLYQSLIHQDGRLLAIVQILVDKKAAPETDETD